MAPPRTSIDLARIRNERFLLRVIAALGGVGSLTFLAQLPSSSFNAGTIPGALITFAMFGGYAWLDRVNTRTVTAGWVRWMATTVEISVPLMFMVPTALVDPLLALHDAPAALWVMAIFVSVLRLTPALTAYAGALAYAAGIVHGPDLAATSVTSLPRETRKGRGVR